MSIIPSDMSALRQLQRQGDLQRLMHEGAIVDICNPLSMSTTWDRVQIIGLLDQPAMLIQATELTIGKEPGWRWMLPQAFRVDS